MTQSASSFFYSQDLKIIDVLRSEKFTLSCEIIPPINGTEQNFVFTQIQELIQSGAEFLSVTKGAGGSLRGGSLPIAQAIKEQLHKPCIAHFTCRDLSKHEIENSLMDHHYFGIRNILALRGDPPLGEKDFTMKEDGYQYAFQLIDQIKKMNDGIFLERTSGGPKASTELSKTDFCIGAAAYPEHRNEKEKIEFFKLKVVHGAEYGITNMLYCPETYVRFLESLEKEKCLVPILPGVRILRSKKQAERMEKRFGIMVPESYKSKLPEEETKESLSEALELFQNLVEKLRRYGAPGIHLYVIQDTESAKLALQKNSKKTMFCENVKTVLKAKTQLQAL